MSMSAKGRGYILVKNRASVLSLNSILDSIMIDILKEIIKYCFHGEKSQFEFRLDIGKFEALRLERIDVLEKPVCLSFEVKNSFIFFFYWKNQIVKQVPWNLKKPFFC